VRKTDEHRANMISCNSSWIRQNARQVAAAFTSDRSARLVTLLRSVSYCRYLPL